MTKHFYRHLKREHATLFACIEGITRQEDRAWYAALLLNRLIFLYFLQKKGCLAITRPESLDGDPHYLRNHLHRLRTLDGGRPGQSFYRSFLLRLFHEGFGFSGHSEACESLFGKLPPMKSDLFAEHELERAYPAIAIPDAAFTRLFAFFDEFDWCLEAAALRNERAITPEVLGTLFEKHSKQKQLGSYYTGADITAYISTATILPWLFEAVKEKCPASFTCDGSVWSLLREQPEQYITSALKHGCAIPLPPEIAAGIQNVTLRAAWNQSAPAMYALPLETWREVVARRQRYKEILERIVTGELCSVDEMITCNLDLCCFARDVIMHCSDADLLAAFYASIEHITILDPTCGTGAFLLAALCVLEPLYEVCLARMQTILTEHDQRNETTPIKHRVARATLSHFRKLLQELANYPARRYGIRKAILTQNLYGIDIMPEAVESCKLRLFLALLAAVESFAEIEPLPALDLHLCVGNALVGCTTPVDLSAAEESAVSQRADLDGVLAARNGVDRLRVGKDYVEKLSEWRQRHQPFHWQGEFQAVIRNGGFAVIIGNPPYVVCGKAGDVSYAQLYRTQTCGNLYAYTLERALSLLRAGGRCGMIVPVSAISSESYRPLSELLLQRQVWISSYSNRPGKLFANVEQRLAILLISNAQPPALFTSAYRHWYEPERAHLFATLTYTRASLWSRTDMPLKSGTELAEAIFVQLIQRSGFPLLRCQRPSAAVWLHNGPTYWVRALPFEPNGGQKSVRSNHYRKIPVSNQHDALVLAAVLSSSTFYLFYKLVSNCRDLGRKELQLFPLGHLQPELAERLAELGRLLAECLQDTSVHCSRRYPSGVSVYEEYYPASAKTILDRIDRVLAEHYGLDAEELDFILNYEIKYRMGQEA